MLKININDDGFAIHGHAEFDEYGKDIVCSAVSFLAQTLAEELKSYDDVEIHKERGMMDVKVNGWDISEKSQVLLEYFENAVTKLAQQYPNNVQIKRI